MRKPIDGLLRLSWTVELAQVDRQIAQRFTRARWRVRNVVRAQLVQLNPSQQGGWRSRFKVAASLLAVCQLPFTRDVQCGLTEVHGVFKVAGARGGSRLSPKRRDPCSYWRVIDAGRWDVVPVNELFAKSRDQVGFKFSGILFREVVTEHLNVVLATEKFRDIVPELSVTVPLAIISAVAGAFADVEHLAASVPKRIDVKAAFLAWGAFPMRYIILNAAAWKVLDAERHSEHRRLRRKLLQRGSVGHRIGGIGNRASNTAPTPKPVAGRSGRRTCTRFYQPQAHDTATRATVSTEVAG